MCKISNTLSGCKIILRKACSRDIDALLRLYTPEKAVSDFSGLHTKKRFQYLIRSREDVLLVAEKEGRIVGALDAEFYDESRFSYFANLVVSKKERRRGIAGQLIAEYERVCRKRKVKTIVVLVYDWNKDMHQVMGRTKYKNKGRLVEYIKELK